VIHALAIETGIEPEYEENLISSARKVGWDVQIVRHVPFVHEFEGADRELLEDPHVWFHGDITACKSAQERTAWQVHAPWEALRCVSYLSRLHGLLVNEPWTIAPMGQLIRRGEAVFDDLAYLIEDDTLFIRPDGNDKIFTGMLVSRDDWEHSLKLITFYEPPDDTLVIFARPRVIQAEARFLVVDGRVVTGSYYKTGGQAVRLKATGTTMAAARRYLMNCLDRGFNPAPSWVLDLAEVDGKWKILEVGASSCCGLYKCDTDLFVRALDRLDPRG